MCILMKDRATKSEYMAPGGHSYRKIKTYVAPGTTKGTCICFPTSAVAIFCSNTEV